MVFRDGLHAMTEQSFATVPAGLAFVDRLLHVFAPRYAFWGADPVLARHAVRETIALSYDGATPPEAALETGLLALVGDAQRDGDLDAAADPRLIVRVILDIYLSENRGWLAGARPELATGVAQLRAALEFALRGVARPARPIRSSRPRA
jgi:hypothetical protein